MDFYGEDKHNALQAKFEAQKIAFGPFVFQAALALRDLGILEAIDKAGGEGIGIEAIAEQLKLSVYGVKVLAEAGLGMRLLVCREGKYSLGNTGYFILHDPMTRVNMDFVQDVNYPGFYKLKEAVKNGTPEGLKVFGDWPTIYQALAHLPEKVKESWFAFDHFYSDAAFDETLPLVFKNKPGSLLDVGGNTGRWAKKCLAYDAGVKITIADLPGQLRMAEKNISESEDAERVSYCPIDLLDNTKDLPEGHDAIWMSQFLDCFSQEEIISILKRAAKAMGPQSRLYILETYWDRQKYEAAAFCLQQTSLYFTCLANGNSQMYHSDDMKSCIAKAGLLLDETDDYLGISHTLFVCRTA